jgi:hypothetical protein
MNGKNSFVKHIPKQYLLNPILFIPYSSKNVFIREFYFLFLFNSNIAISSTKTSLCILLLMICNDVSIVILSVFSGFTNVNLSNFVLKLFYKIDKSYFECFFINSWFFFRFKPLCFTLIRSFSVRPSSIFVFISKNFKSLHKYFLTLIFYLFSISYA